MWFRSVVLVLTGCLILTPIPAASSSVVGDEVAISSFLETTGTQEFTAQKGAARLDPTGAWSNFHLKAESIVIDSDWERGVKESSFFGFVTRQGNESRKINDVEASFEQFQGEPVFLAFNDGREMDLHLTSGADALFGPDEDVSVVEVGPSPDGVGAGYGMGIGFWYNTKGQIIQGESSGSIRIQGDFTLFVHNAYFHALGVGDEWSDWTGYKEQNPDLPATQYEFRATKIQVTNGTFQGAGEKEIDLFVPSLNARIDGTVGSTSASGNLLGDQEIFLFDDDPLHLEGVGSFTLETMEPIGTTKAMALSAQGDFQVRGASKVEPARDQQENPTPYIAVLLSTMGLLAAVMTSFGLVGLGVVRAPNQSIKESIHGKWIEKAEKNVDGGRFDRASRYYKTATRVDPDEGFAWFGWAEAELLAGHPEKADAVALLADLVPAVDHLDILALRAIAAWRRDDWTVFDEFLEELAELNSGMAHALVKGLEIKPDELSSHIRLAITEVGLEGAMNGYS